VLAVAVDGPDDLRKMIARIARDDGNVPRFPLLSDPGHKVIDRYGLLNPIAAARGLPHPATYVIDRKGIVRWKFVEVDYKRRPTNEQIFEAVRALR